ncbi:transposase [Hymenobacter sp.]|uniref:transposase n=1 Tax=Hymenobacter sp. TaxID=1898978 RepID=UPI0039C882B7
MPEKKPTDGQPIPRKKYTPAFTAECVRQVAAGARQSDVARAQGISPTLPGRWQRAALEQALTLRQPGRAWLSTPTGTGSTPVGPAASASPTRGCWPATPGRATPTTTHKRKRAGATELLPHGGAAWQKPRRVAYYLDTYFNLGRRHSALGYRSPHQFEVDLLQHLPQYPVRSG